ncbi:conserved hypothetical protein [Flavobacterium sp. 9AF]|uniref:hypothetical protein n=1 Tax=Flavobacterium sp. 9AF TaxID=2653142 RepID=UPI0012F40AE3|nr:hypothetical protein [Flavobacterium sp. 9AF]VXB07714.1 conserved hypothetical protein [Flavobacterium sp. 9AF]
MKLASILIYEEESAKNKAVNPKWPNLFLLSFLKRIAFFFLFFLFLGLFLSIKPIEEYDCDLLHEGTFVYYYENKKIKVVIHEKDHIEYHENGKYEIHSKIEWINDCEFVTTCVKNTFPNPTYDVEDQMYVKVNRIVKNEIYFTSSINRFSWSGKMVKVE